ncbi:MAG: hypothetical protein HQL27_06800, partial [Candidatus Omnitrophica bacterium]|nr:hypothetical protein [Candidatus Omnitrophota bacterium]
KIVQVMLEEEYSMGIDWDAIVSDYQSIPFNGFARPSGNEEEDGRIGLGTISTEDCNILLDALETVGTKRIIENSLRESKLNKESTITINENQLLLGGKRGDTYEEIELKEIKYSLLPRISAKGLFITFKPGLDIVKGDTVSIKDRERKSADIFVPEESTVIVGGLFKSIMMDTINKVPFLGSLPFLGIAFRSSGQMLQKTEVILFLTPMLTENEAK